MALSETQFQVGDPVVVTEKGAHHGRVTKVARKYLTVCAGSREWEFDKLDRAPRGEHCGYVPQLRTPDEHARHVAWEQLRSAWNALPYSIPPHATTEQMASVAGMVRLWAARNP